MHLKASNRTIINYILFKSRSLFPVPAQFQVLDLRLRNYSSESQSQVVNVNPQDEYERSKVNIKGKITQLIEEEHEGSCTSADMSTHKNRPKEDLNEMFRRIDWSRITDAQNLDKINENIKMRKSGADMSRLTDYWSQFTENLIKGNIFATSNNNEIIRSLTLEALKLPNMTHQESISCNNADGRGSPKRIFLHDGDRNPGSGSDVDSKIRKPFHELMTASGALRTENIGLFTGPKSYYFLGPLAELEHALIRYTYESLQKRGFLIVSVPDILYPEIIEGCGMATLGKRNLVYWLQHKEEDPEFCLSGTSEMAFGGYIRNKIFSEKELPLKFASVSRCYRAEISTVGEEKGIYRVHEFTKVEMFGVTKNDPDNSASENLQLEFRKIQEEIFSELGIGFQTLEMPPIELGASAYRKFDIEAWMPGKKFFGEISSCSNCTDYQSRRLNAQYEKENGQLEYVHTVNGTACAVPRMLMSIIETYQDPNSPGGVNLPEPLKKYMDRSWNDSISSTPNIKSVFLKANSQIDRCIRKIVKYQKRQQKQQSNEPKK